MPEIKSLSGKKNQKRTHKLKFSPYSKNKEKLQAKHEKLINEILKEEENII